MIKDERQKHGIRDFSPNTETGLGNEDKHAWIYGLRPSTSHYSDIGAYAVRSIFDLLNNQLVNGDGTALGDFDFRTWAIDLSQQTCLRTGLASATGPSINSNAFSSLT